jgi:hypothetical protein
MSTSPPLCCISKTGRWILRRNIFLGLLADEFKFDATEYWYTC